MPTFEAIFLGDYINVKTDFSAVGNGVADDTLAIQAAFDAAFGGGAFSGLPIYFPSGNYRITAPLTLVNVAGGLIKGAGNGEKGTQILYQGAGDEGNSLDELNPTFTPAIILDGVSYTVLEDFSLGCTPDTTHTIGIYVYESGDNGYTGGNAFRNINVNDFHQGILAGAPAGNCDDCQLQNVQFNRCDLYGLRIVGLNALNWVSIGGGASNCASATTYDPATSTSGNFGAAYSVVDGSLCLIGAGCTGNGWDVIAATTQGVTVQGLRSESHNSIAAVGGNVNVTGVIFGGGDPNTDVCMLDMTFSGQISATNCSFAMNGLTGSGTHRLARLGNNGLLVLDNCGYTNYADVCGISGASGARFWMRGCNGDKIPSASTLFGSYTGTVVEYDQLLNVAVSALPSAAAKFQGLRGMVTDANATTFLSTVAGSGSNKVPVVCDGSNWKIG